MDPAEAPAPSKREIRARVLAARAALDPTVEAERAVLIAGHILSLAVAMHAQTVAAYVSVGGEPGTQAAIERLRAGGVTVILPILCDDFDLDWAEFVPGGWRPGRFGLIEPTAPPRGRDAIREAALIVCPGVAGTISGQRLGRGGGSYDRALARALPSAMRCLLLYDDEVMDDVPTEPHDERVDALVTPHALVPVFPGRTDRPHD